MEINKYYVIINITTLNYMSQGYQVRDITEAEGFTTEKAARGELKTYDEPQNYEVYEVEETISRCFKLIPGNIENQ